MIRATDSCERAFYELVDRCLDDRRDPLDEPEVIAFLAANPEHLDAFVGEREALRALGHGATIRPLNRVASSSAAPQVAKPAKRTPCKTELLSAVAVAAAAGIALWFVLSNPCNAEASQFVADQPDPDQRPASQRPPRILSATLQEDAPMLNAAASYTVHDHLVRTDSVLFEAYEQRSQRRQSR